MFFSKKLKVGQVVFIDGDKYRVVLKPCSNGRETWEIPILKLVRNEEREIKRLKNAVRKAERESGENCIKKEL